MSTTTHKADQDGDDHAGSGVKETLTSLVIAFAMAFVFRGFVLEAFLIPTGSMAPTLLGAHMRFQSPVSGVSWTVGPWEYADNANQVPKKIQSNVTVHDPMTGTPVNGRNPGVGIGPRSMPRLAGDRIFVLKYLYSIFDPARFDIVVFKNPTQPTENYIKRLIGLPGDQIALIDGDVFRRRHAGDDPGDETNLWLRDGWSIARKTLRVQDASWYPIYDSRFVPRGVGISGEGPWVLGGSGWTGDPLRSPRFEGSGGGELSWDTRRWPLTDFVSYNEHARRPATFSGQRPRGGANSLVPVMRCSDLRTSCSLRPTGDGLVVAASLRTRGHEFRGVIEDGVGRVEMRGDGGAWTVLDDGASSPLRAGEVSIIDFWHVDQALWLFVDGSLVAGGPVAGAYDWTPGERVERTLGMTIQDAVRLERNVFVEGTRYTAPELGWSLRGSGFEVVRSAVWRDLYYQPATHRGDRLDGEPGLATHPQTTLTLGADQFFTCGDNSAQSLDGRLWDRVDPWVADAYGHAQVGVVPRELLIGKAFFVYFPAIQKRGVLFVPDFGRMRFLW